jgi:hypothetical protein
VQCFADGMNRKDMAELVGADVKTITNWRRQQRVRDAVRKLLQDRVQRVTAKVDSEIEARMLNAGRLTIRELLEIRKEFAGGAFRDQINDVTDDDINAASEALEENPNLAEELAALLHGRGAQGAHEAK